jgi:thioester reductase-like protein
MATVLFTGFPGVLGMELLPRVLERRAGDTALCLVQSKFADLARRRIETLAAARPRTAGRIKLVEGDITRPALGLANGDLPLEDVVEIHHLAAIYDLSVARAPAMKVNVEGTRHVLDVAERCSRLERLHYVSTCYVSGKHPGRFGEDDLEVGQSFANAYEETKDLAEVEVRARMKAGLPATIYRPAIVVGDSTSGDTQKYDGPYYVMRWLMRQPGPLALMPTIGDLSAEVNLVPRDFVIAAIAYLSGLPAAKGKCYQLADPAPLRVDALLDVVGRAVGKRVVKLPLPLGVAKWAIDSVPGVYPMMQIPSAAIDYFVLPTRYDTRNTVADLAGSGIACPPFPTYVDRLVAFVRAHPDVGASAMA